MMKARRILKKILAAAMTASVAGAFVPGLAAGTPAPDERTHLYFFGSQDHTVVDGHPSLSPGEDSYSWEFWAMIDPAASGWGLPIEYPGGNRYYVGYNAANGWNFVVAGGGSRTDTNADAWLARITGRWVFVQAVLDVETRNQTLRVYDWANDAWHEANVTPGEGPNVNSGTLYIPSPPGRFPYQGSLQEMRFWRTVRTQEDAMNDMMNRLTGAEEHLEAYWPMNEGSGRTVFNQTGDTHHGTIMGNPRWDGGWGFAFDPVTAPVDFDFGTGPGQEDGENLLRNFPDKFTLGEDFLRYAATRSDAFSSTALAVVDNYLNRQNFVLGTNFLVTRFGGAGGTRVGLAALAGPHSDEARFDSIDDRGFYGFVWVPARDAQTSSLEIREGFRGPLLAEIDWEGISPATRVAPDGPGEGVLFFEGFEDLAAVNAAWTTGGATDLWEFGQPAGGPGSAYAGENVAGTGLGTDGQYPTNTEAWLRSPVIDLTGEAGPLALSFREFLDVDPEFDEDGLFHFTIVNLLDTDLNLIAEVSRDAATLDDWRLRQIQIPEEALNRPIILEFRLESDPFQGGMFDGWFLDDIAIAGFQPMEYQMTAEGTYLRTGGLELTLTLTDENGFSQSLTAIAANPVTGNLFGFGGQLEPAAQGNWEFAFADFGIELGTWSLPLSFGPTTTVFGSAEGLGGAGNFFQNLPQDWSVATSALHLAPVSTEPRNSLAVGQIGNYEAGEPFHTRLSLTLVGLNEGETADNAVGLVLFGDEDPEVFDAENDTTFHSLQWMPNPASGSRLVFRRGMNGPVVAEVAFADLPNPPAAPPGAVGTSYELEFFGTANSSGDLAYVAHLRDENGGIATLSGILVNPPSGNHFGFGARHGAAGDPVWQFNRFDWFNIHPLEQPAVVDFGSGIGRNDARDFFKSGVRPGDWSLGESSLQLSRDFLSGAGTGAVSAMANIRDYRAGMDFSVRSSVTTSVADEQPVFLRFDGLRDYIPVPGNETLMPREDDFSWEFWARVGDSASGWNIPIEYPTGDRHFIGFNTGNGWSFMLVSNGSRTDTFRDRYIANFTGRWVFVQAVLERQNSQQILRVYDPAMDIWHEAQVIPAVGQTQNTGDLNIPSANASFRFNGDLREMRFWRKARTRAEAEADMKQPLSGGEADLAAYWPMTEGSGDMVTDQTINGNNGFFVGEPQWVSFETVGDPTDISLDHLGPFVRFDGNNDYGIVQEDPALTPGEDSYSWEFWSRIDPETTGWNLPIEYRGGNRYYIGYRADAGWNYIVTANGVRTDTFTDRWLARLPGQWVFVQAVLDSANARQTLRVYDPVKDEWHQAEVVPGAGPNNNTGVLHLPSTAFPYRGDLREVRFWRKVRTQGEAEADMYQPLDGDEENLAAYWPMNEGFGSTLNDISGNENHSALQGSPRWITGGSFRDTVTLGLTALGGGGFTGASGNFFDRSFRLEWLPSANLGGGELWLTSPAGGHGPSRLNLSNIADGPLFTPGSTYTFELSGFYQENGALNLVGALEDEFGRRAELIHHVNDPAALQLDSWFGIAAKLPESATRYDWHTFEMGTPLDLGIEPPDFGIQSYADWLVQNFTAAERENPAVSDRLASPVGDGIANLLKYALGFDPWSLVKGGDLTRMEIHNGKLRLTYADRRQAYDIEYVPQASETLTLWNGDVIEVARGAHPQMADFDLVTVEAVIPDEASQAFLRLMVQERP